MTAVTKYGLSYKDPNSIALPAPVYSEGRVRCIATGQIAVASGDSANSKFYLGKVPSSAILIPSMCILHHGAITTLDDFDIGIELNGSVLDADGLADGLDLTSAGTKSVVNSVALANIGKPLWQLSTFAVPYTVDPGVEFDVVGVMKAASTASTTIAAFIGYSKK